LRTLPIYGRGLGFPFRVGPTGGAVVTTGCDDNVSVALQYLAERWTIREDSNPAANHIAESIAHILLTRPTEHDTLPPFGSHLFHILFEPNTQQFQMAATHYFQYSTDRWEKRAYYGREQGKIVWTQNNLWTDRGELPILAYIDFIPQQVPGNLVAPFVTPREARGQEYPLGDVDLGGHDYSSRYFGESLWNRDGIQYIRFQRPYIPKMLPPARDDQFYRVREDDTWLLISWRLYDDIRYWSILAAMYVQDSAEQNLGRDTMDNTGNPASGTVLRAPSKVRVLMELSGA
jgi:hypothetical protein